MSSLEIFDNFCKKYSISKPTGLLIRIFNRVFLVPKKYTKYLSKFQPQYAGLCLGKIVKKTFIPTTVFYEKYMNTIPIISVDQKQAQFFVYQKTVLNIRSQSKQPIVRVSYNDSIIGIGKIKKNSIIPLHDIGQSFRDEIQ